MSRSITLPPLPRDRRLTLADYLRAAATLEVPIEAVYAVASVESSGGGFLADGKPKVLFEAHVFSRLTRRAYDRSHPQLSSPAWNRALYSTGPTEEIRGQREWDRLDRAMALNRAAAIMAASWGLFQIMGFNHGACGVTGVGTWVNLMQRDEGAHLDLFCALVQSWSLVDEMRDQRWADFARVYNGPAFAQNKYDVKMAAAFRSARTALAALPRERAVA